MLFILTFIKFLAMSVCIALTCLRFDKNWFHYFIYWPLKLFSGNFIIKLFNNFKYLSCLLTKSQIKITLVNAIYWSSLIACIRCISANCRKTSIIQIYAIKLSKDMQSHSKMTIKILSYDHVLMLKQKI